MQTFFSINAYAPVIQQSFNSYHERLLTEKETYTIATKNGFNNAAFTLHGEQEYLIDWFKNGLARDIVWRGPDGLICWNGYVDALSLSIGGITRTKSIDKMANRITYVYESIDTSTNPPGSNGQASLTLNDTASQTAFGIKEQTISGGEVSSTVANVDALSRLFRLKDPVIGETSSVGKGVAPLLSVSMKGYANILDWFVYTQTAVSSTANADVVIKAVLAADPNSIISTADTFIDSNTTATEQFQEKQPGWKVIDAITQRGQDVASVGRRWVAGVYANRQLEYKAGEDLGLDGQPLSTNKHLILQRSIADPGDVFTDESGKVIDYWHLRPDRLLMTQGIPGDVAYIRQVTFTAPITVTLVGDDDLQPLAGIVRV